MDSTHGLEVLTKGRASKNRQARKNCRAREITPAWAKKEPNMIETRWYDAFLLVVKYGEGRLEVRLGAVCLLVIVVVIWKVIRAMMSRSSDG